eukprot:2516620-Pleurochrysis_carterae.AAC.1
MQLRSSNGRASAPEYSTSACVRTYAFNSERVRAFPCNEKQCELEGTEATEPAGTEATEPAGKFVLKRGEQERDFLSRRWLGAERKNRKGSSRCFNACKGCLCGGSGLQRIFAGSESVSEAGALL